MVLTALLATWLIAAPCMVSADSKEEAFWALYGAARTNDVEGVRKAIADGADLNQRGQGGQTPIMAATLSGSTDVVKLLLDEYRGKVDLSIGEQDGYTPMHGAGFQGRHAVARLLLDAGLNPSDRHRDGYTPIHRACWGTEKRHTKTVKVLLEEGKVDVDELSNGMTPLDSAMRNGNSRTIKLLKSMGARTAQELRQAQEVEAAEGKVEEHDLSLSEDLRVEL
eukprot:CAMPEP_0202909808 /NCGR_PEP_ID=MMETSP1392-20130828/50328_1 /ASSEMBLY_ACC=CAM_ASM_000868 /TAXON_ID=225041 /ORGANISM="Chlamydomonas chlamydogama, Strain SAG 11-48b" /LENGTH=222 /DNA_ID=CAMNT_0049599677 /DNA_START=254 /DNA_END=922 /DNA_ORIENTATION=-